MQLFIEDRYFLHHVLFADCLHLTHVLQVNRMTRPFNARRLVVWQIERLSVILHHIENQGQNQSDQTHDTDRERRNEKSIHKRLVFSKEVRIQDRTSYIDADYSQKVRNGRQVDHYFDQSDWRCRRQRRTYHRNQGHISNKQTASAWNPAGEQSIAIARTIFLPEYQQTYSCQDHNRYKDANHINDRILVDWDFDVGIVPSFHLVNLDTLQCFLLSRFDCSLIASLHTLDFRLREVCGSINQTKNPSLWVIESIFVDENSLMVWKEKQSVIGYLVLSSKWGSRYFGLPINMLLIDSEVILLSLLLTKLRKERVRIVFFGLTFLDLVKIVQVTYWDVQNHLVVNFDGVQAKDYFYES